MSQNVDKLIMEVKNMLKLRAGKSKDDKKELLNILGTKSNRELRGSCYLRNLPMTETVRAVI